MIVKRINFDPEFAPVDIPVVIEKEYFDAAEKAPVLIERARKEASRIRKNIKEVLAQTVVEKEEERKRGYEDGFQQGLSQVTEQLLQVEQEREKMMAEAEPQMIRMIADIAEKVIGREIAAGAIVDIVKKTIAQAVGQKLAVRVNPADLETIRHHEPEIIAALGPLRTVTIRDDESLPAGGCVVESEAGTVDARLETQMAAIRKALGL